MQKKFILSLILVPFIFLAACEDDNDNTPTEVGVSIPQISLTCSNSDATACQDANSNEDVMFVWTTAACDEINEDTVLYANTSLDQYRVICNGNDCVTETQPNTGVWFDSSGDVTEVIPSSATTAVAWIDFGDSGVNNDNGPSGGDVVCCLEDQESDVEMPSSSCQQL